MKQYTYCALNHNELGQKAFSVNWEWAGHKSSQETVDKNQLCARKSGSQQKQGEDVENPKEMTWWDVHMKSWAVAAKSRLPLSKSVTTEKLN